MKIDFIYELNGNERGDIVGVYCPGHIEKGLFYGWAVTEYTEYLEWQNEEEQEETIYPFGIRDIQHKYIRHPTEQEIENSEYESEDQFIFSDSEEEGMQPITLVYFR